MHSPLPPDAVKEIQQGLATATTATTVPGADRDHAGHPSHHADHRGQVMGGFLSRLLGDLQAALKDPRADPRQTVLFLGGAVLLVLIVIVALLFFVSEGPSAEAPADQASLTRNGGSRASSYPA